jgi:hypothetical protein
MSNDEDLVRTAKRAVVKAIEASAPGDQRDDVLNDLAEYTLKLLDYYKSDRARTQRR